MKTKPTYPEFVARIIARGNGNPKGLDAIKRALQPKCPLPTWAQYKKMLDRADAYMNISDDPEWRNRWFLVQCRILQAMTCPKIFFR